MNEPLDQTVRSVVPLVLETAAFMTIWPFQESDGELPVPDVSASMTFSGPCSGRLTLRVATEILPLLTQNMLGELEPDDSPEEKGRDALKEVLNMICGNLLTEWQGSDPIFHLSPPEIEDLNTLANSVETCAASVKFTLENTLAIVDVKEM